MDAFFRGILIANLVASMTAGSCWAAYTTPNFVVHAPTAEFAKRVGDAAEYYRRELAVEWTGKPLADDWSHPCPIHVIVGNMGAGGETKFNFSGSKVYGWKMEIRGSEQRILDSVLPHEINHTIFATLFRRPLPRWADEGAASLIEHESEQNQLRQIHIRAISNRRKIPLKTLLEIRQYPTDQQEVLTLYAEGHSLADFLIQKGDKLRYLNFLQMAYERDWESAVRSLYQYESIDRLERDWDQWVQAGSQKSGTPQGAQVAVNDRSTAAAPTIRGQSPTSGMVLGEPMMLVPADRSAESEPKDLEAVITAEEKVTQSPPRRKRSTLNQPILTIDLTTTGAAKVAQDRSSVQFD